MSSKANLEERMIHGSSSLVSVGSTASSVSPHILDDNLCCRSESKTRVIFQLQMLLGSYMLRKRNKYCQKIIKSGQKGQNVFSALY
jgi:hypothetical protein